MQDSGAFSDGPAQRLTFQEAYDRQLAHAEQYGYTEKVLYRASYDLLIDEKWHGGVRHKERWSETEAEMAVRDTVGSADFLKRQADGPSVLSVQGVTVQQYLHCAKDIISLMDDDDVLGLGGWCITGKMPRRMMPVLLKTMSLVVPYAARQGVSSAHIWGVLYPPALGALLWYCNQYGIALSTDSAGPVFRPAFGEWGYGDWTDNSYERKPPSVRGLESAKHVALTIEWLSSFETTRWYREPVIAEQMYLFEGREL